ncbi:MAG: YdiU family protein [Pseudomonadales bacterium]
MINFTNSYAQLGDAFYERVLPTPASKPELMLWNASLADSLQIGEPLSTDAALQAQVFSGNQLTDGADSMALAYSGHQFGQLNPQLGDGRAHLLGEVLDENQQRFDIQLKGSGPTPYSRRGDGRCALGPAVREFVMSEAMYYLGVPTSRCLAVVTTGDTVFRDTVKPGAVVTRIAASHIRVGTFVYFAIRKDLESLKALMDHSIERHFPEINTSEDGNKALQFLQAAINKQITLVVAWMRVGFIHGVMNTDNCAISGETIDFGPCAMMGNYNPDTVFSSIDTQGRYAFGKQPSITLWNMTRLAETLLPLIAEDQDEAIALVTPVLDQFGEQFQSAYFKMYANKLGLTDVAESERDFISDLLQALQDKELDYTQSFIRLSESLEDETLAAQFTDQLGESYTSWRSQLDGAKEDMAFAKALMKANNPLVIPRNHHIEAVLAACEESGSSQAADDILAVLRSPYDEIATTSQYQDLPADGDIFYRTFCGT